MGSDKTTKLAIVVPCYNEDKVLGVTIPRLLSFVDDLIIHHGCAPDSFIVLVDDGSRDDTWSLIAAASIDTPGRLRGIRLACNVGHQGALLSGLDYVTGQCDAAVSIDADLQADLAAIPRMLQEFSHGGGEIILGIRSSREFDTWFKRNTALAFYKLMKLIGVSLVENHADFRLMSAKALYHLSLFPESNLFLRGFPFLLHKEISTVSYQRTERVAGKTKYPLSKMLSLAWNGITSFSIVPLRLISVIGGLVFFSSLIMILYIIIAVLTGKTLMGWASIVVPIYLLGGLIMLSIGVVGEYVGKVFLEVKRRPRFLVDTIIGGSSNDD